VQDGIVHIFFSDLVRADIERSSWWITNMLASDTHVGPDGFFTEDKCVSIAVQLIDLDFGFTHTNFIWSHPLWIQSRQTSRKGPLGWNINAIPATKLQIMAGFRLNTYIFCRICGRIRAESFNEWRGIIQRIPRIRHMHNKHQQTIQHAQVTINL
jgi:hypothetical protein